MNPDVEAEARRNTGAPRYARFSRRLKAMIIDWIVAMAIVFGAVSLAVATGNDNVSRALGFLAIATLLLYEPTLVSCFGGTIGHYRANLRVVDDRTHGNPGFGKSLLRFVLKSVLGIYSFAVMAATRRNQTIHDLLTRSTVQIRDASRALPHHYMAERTEILNPDMPSRWRRAAIILAYLAVTFAVYIAVLYALNAVGALSLTCLDNDRCSVAENALLITLGLALLAVGALCIGLGWRGKLFGARVTAAS